MGPSETSSWTRMSLLSVALLLLTTSLHTTVGDIICLPGKSPGAQVVHVGSNQAFGYKTQHGETYGRHTRCAVVFKKSSSCPSLVVSCPKFDIAHPKANCKGKGGDFLAIGKKRFCQNKGPNNFTSTAGKLTVSFNANKKVEGEGAECTIACSDLEPTSLGGNNVSVQVNNQLGVTVRGRVLFLACPANPSLEYTVDPGQTATILNTGDCLIKGISGNDGTTECVPFSSSGTTQTQFQIRASGHGCVISPAGSGAGQTLGEEDDSVQVKNELSVTVTGEVLFSSCPDSPSHDYTVDAGQTATINRGDCDQYITSITGNDGTSQCNSYRSNGTKESQFQIIGIIGDAGCEINPN